MQRLEVSGAVRPIYGSLGIKRLTAKTFSLPSPETPDFSIVTAAFKSISSRCLILSDEYFH